MKPYRVLFFGTWGYGRAGLQALISLNQVQLVRVFSKWDTASADPYLNQVYLLAKKNHIRVVNSDKKLLSKESFHEILFHSEEVDFLISCCYDRFFPARIRSFPDLGALNIHPSLLPRYRGVKPLENALANGENHIGVTLHELSRELDAGDIVLQRSVGITVKDSFGALYQLQCQLIIDCIREFFSRPEFFLTNKRPQQHEAATDAPRLPFLIEDSDTVLDIINKKKAHLEL